MSVSLINQLLEKKIINKQRAVALEYELKNSEKREEDIIMENKIASEDSLFSLKSELLKIPLKNFSADEVSLKILEIIPEESAKYYKMIPLLEKGGQVEIGMVYPDDIKAREALDFLAKQSKFSYKISLITPSNLEELLKKYRTLRQEVTKALEELETELEEEKIETKKPKSELERVVEEAPISKVVAVMLRHAVEGNASDVHIEPTRDKVRVRFRLDGVLHSSLFLPLKVLSAVVARIKILANLKIDETRIPQDGRFSAKFDEREVDFRISTLPTALGEKVVLRILDPNQRKISLADLGVMGRSLEVIERAVKKPYGMLLATGPTGSGKTTTLYAVLGLLNKDEANVVSLEDPVEYFMEGVNQSQIRPEIGYDFATGLRTLVRQDPDIIMVGEIRDEETASLAIHAALTGHIILSTLHTNNTIGAIPRLIDMGVRPFLIPPALSAILAQRLVRKLCPFCKKKVKPQEGIKKTILKDISNFPPLIKQKIKMTDPFYVFEPVGCKKCGGSGYSGRIGVFEILEMTDQLAEIIYTDPVENKIEEEARRQGMLKMKQDGVLKVLEGLTSFEELLDVTED